MIFPHIQLFGTPVENGDCKDVLKTVQVPL